MMKTINFCLITIVCALFWPHAKKTKNPGKLDATRTIQGTLKMKSIRLYWISMWIKVLPELL